MRAVVVAIAMLLTHASRMPARATHACSGDDPSGCHHHLPGLWGGGVLACRSGAPEMMVRVRQRWVSVAPDRAHCETGPNRECIFEMAVACITAPCDDFVLGSAPRGSRTVASASALPRLVLRCRAR